MSLCLAKRKRAAEEGEEKEEGDQSEGGEQNQAFEEPLDDEDGYIDDEDEPHKFGNSILPVANLPESFDGVPQDGMEYLFTVRREERNLPFVTKVVNPYVREETSQATSAAYTTTETVASQSLIPSEEWQTCFEDRFRHLRANMRQSVIHVSIPNSSQPKLPDMRERDRWWGFFRGDTEWHRIPNSEGKRNSQHKKEYEVDISRRGEKMRGWQIYEEPLSWDQPEDNVAESTSKPGGDNLNLDEHPNGEEDKVSEDELCRKHENVAGTAIALPKKCVPGKLMTNKGLVPREPTPRILSLLDQKTILQLLKFFTQWIQGHFDRTRFPSPPTCLDSREDASGNVSLIYELTPSHARWVFALLTRLDPQLSSNEISILRNLAREVFRLVKEERTLCESRPQSVKVMGMGEAGCWMIVAAVIGVWGQKDLWMDAATALR